MFAWLLTNLINPEYLLANPWLILPLLFELWMLVDAIRRGEHMWAIFIFLFPILNAVLYFFMVYRGAPKLQTRGFELPGAQQKQRISELLAQIHHLDKAHHHAQLGDVYFQQGKLEEAEKSYRAAMERDATDVDFPAHLGQCLLRQGQAAEAKSLLEEVVRQDTKHDYGHTMMAYAEALRLLGQKAEALKVWESVLEHHSYARARVQAAELYIESGEPSRAKAMLAEMLDDEKHTASFERKRDKVWVKRAKGLLKELE